MLFIWHSISFPAIIISLVSTIWCPNSTPSEIAILISLSPPQQSAALRLEDKVGIVLVGYGDKKPVLHPIELRPQCGRNWVFLFLSGGQLCNFAGFYFGFEELKDNHIVGFHDMIAGIYLSNIPLISLSKSESICCVGLNRSYSASALAFASAAEILPRLGSIL